MTVRSRSEGKTGRICGAHVHRFERRAEKQNKGAGSGQKGNNAVLMPIAAMGAQRHAHGSDIVIFIPGTGHGTPCPYCLFSFA
jgi:hypothetical protein